MSFGQASTSLNLFAPQPRVAAPAVARSLSGPQLEVRWGSFRQSLGSSVRAVVSGPSPSKKFLSSEVFKDCWIEGRIPRAPVFAAALWHIVFLVIPWPQMPARPHTSQALENFQLTWSGPINDFPVLKISTPQVSAPTARGDAAKPLAVEGADAFHPRQRIFTDPLVPTHPRQTLINSAAPPRLPKFCPICPTLFCCSRMLRL